MPVATLSRFEREGAVSLDAFLRLLHALGVIDDFSAWLKDQERHASLPRDISALKAATARSRKRVRAKNRGHGSD